MRYGICWANSRRSISQRRLRIRDHGGRERLEYSPGVARVPGRPASVLKSMSVRSGKLLQPLRKPVFLLAVCVCCAQQPVLRQIEWNDLTEPARVLAQHMEFSRSSFAAQVRAIGQRTGERLREGELDHLIYYLLQSRSFTSEPPIDPAKSAVAYMSSPERAISADVIRRIDDFTRALAKPHDDRLRYFAQLAPAATAAAVFRREYDRAMQFLYRKEAECPAAAQPQQCVAGLYQNRGHSSDTAPSSNEAVTAALYWLRDHSPRSVHRALVIGPGDDFAPRTGFVDGDHRRVYQPQLLRKELLASGLAAKDLLVDCADINARVLQSAASACGVTAQLNVVTERPREGWPRYDLIIATNVLLYMDDRELLLAFHNIRYMLSSNGVFVHNDGRFEIQLFGKAAGLSPVRFGTVTLDMRRTPALVDRFVIHVPAAAKL